MEVQGIRVFIPCRDYQTSQSFYQALGFEMSQASEDLSIFESGGSTFFLQRYYNKELAENLMLQLIVPDIQEAYAAISKIQGHDFRYEPVKDERWGKVIYMGAHPVSFGMSPS